MPKEPSGPAIGWLEEIAFDQDWISLKELQACADMITKNDYGLYLEGLLHA